GGAAGAQGGLRHGASGGQGGAAAGAAAQAADALALLTEPAVIERLAMWASLGELAVRLGCELRGDPDTRVERVAALGNADERSIAFLANPRYRAQLAATRAGAVVLNPASADECPTAVLLCDNPYATFARVATILHPLPHPE